MNNYLLKIEYDGSKFVGWQFQKNGISVQETIEKKLKKILKTKIKLIGSGRTDRGVHAKAQFANFKIEKKIESKIKFLNSANFFLKKYLISIIDIKKKNWILIHVILRKKGLTSIKLLIGQDHSHLRKIELGISKTS